MTVYPHCKINLGLHITSKRPDGYHNLETIFVPVYDLHDQLDITPLPSSSGNNPSSQMLQTGIPLDNPPDDNLCLAAWRLMHHRYGIPPVRIHLHKNIPFGAGLGGGSSDAAFTLRALNDLFSLHLNDTDLLAMAHTLGSDCAFFLMQGACYATGTGDILTPCDEVDRLMSHFHIRIQIPDGEHIATKEAYAGLHHDLFGAPRPDLLEAIHQPIDQWRSLIANDFEASVFPTHPAIAALKEEMYHHGARYASMTGSGAAVFGLFDK